ncbi:MAG: dipeptide ABC transporter ATP-binding protein [Thermosynechococcaceae cyanobacterium]
MVETLLCIDDLRVAYPQSRTAQEFAVDGVSLSIAAGDRIGLVGESGCGKSTIGRAIMRLLPRGSALEGDIQFQGQSVLELSASELRHFRGERVALVFQDPMTRLNPVMTIKHHCLETLQAHQPQLSGQAAQTKALETLAAVNIPAERWRQYPHEFSGGMRQRVAIALALLLDPKMIVADEPTTSLDVTVAAQILDELTRLCAERQMGLLLISHDLALVSEYCDRIAVMYEGKIVEMGLSQALLTQPQHPYTQSLVQAARDLQASSLTIEAQAELPQPLLSIKELRQYYTLSSGLVGRFLSGPPQTIKAVDDVSLDIYPGEIVGLVGESGCGKSTLSRTILQLVRPTAGSVVFDGADLTGLTTAQVRGYRRELQMIFQDPLACLNPLMTVGKGIAEPLLIHNLATPETAPGKVNAMLERVGLTPAADYLYRYPGDLSGGQQQRVAIARALITHPKLVICDEPVSMLDASIQTQVLELMQELKEEFQLTYLFITHDLWVARFFCDRIAVMNQGKIVEIGPTHQIFTAPQHPYTQTLLGAAPLLATIQ